MSSPLKVDVYPHIDGRCHGNIIWAERNLGSPYYRVSKYAMRGGKFPDDHPVCGNSGTAGQYGDGATISAFRERGYWASCFPEGDGITWKPERGQSFEQTCDDIRECFGWVVVPKAI